MSRPAAFVYSAEQGAVVYSERHPFRPARYIALERLLEDRDLLPEDRVRRIAPRVATREELTVWHDPGLVDALARADDGTFEPGMLRHGVGRGECPVFPGVFRYASLAAGGTLLACDGVADGRWSAAFVPSGGFHHALADHAEGFCYLNDVVLGARRLADRGLGGMVIDMDAHHGNGTQAAFYDDDRVVTVSFHETGESLYPWGGFQGELGAGRGAGWNINVPLLGGTDTDATLWAFSELVPPLLERVRPDVVLLVMGGDVLAQDPLTHLRCTNQLARPVVDAVKARCPRIVMLGSGGYHEEATVRYWALAWAALIGRRLESPFEGLVGGVFLGAQDLQGGDLLDMKVYAQGEEKAQVWSHLQQVVGGLQEALDL